MDFQLVKQKNITLIQCQKYKIYNNGGIDYVIELFRMDY